MKLLNLKKLQKAIILALGVVPLMPVNAALNLSPLGVYTGQPLSNALTTPYKAFSDYETANQGWTHSAKFLTLTVGSEQDIAAGKTYDVTLTMTGRGALGSTAASAIDNPAFALWTAGTGTISPDLAYGQHGWNPTRGPNEDAVNVDGTPDQLNINDNFRGIGVLNGRAGWIGYVNAGPAYTLINQKDPLTGASQTTSGKSVLDAVSHGAVNTTSKTWLTKPEASSTTYTSEYFLQGANMVGAAADSATMTLYGLKAGNYLIATGGSCPTNPEPAVVCGKGTQYTFTVQPADSSTADCLFNWAEVNYPGLFAPATKNTQQIWGYDYRYYAATNTYLGVLNGVAIHILQPSVSQDIINVGTVAAFKPLTGCQ